MGDDERESKRDMASNEGKRMLSRSQEARSGGEKMARHEQMASSVFSCRLSSTFSHTGAPSFVDMISLQRLLSWPANRMVSDQIWCFQPLRDCK
jgi:hypothetical protein